MGRMRILPPTPPKKKVFFKPIQRIPAQDVFFFFCKKNNFFVKQPAVSTILELSFFDQKTNRLLVISEITLLNLTFVIDGKNDFSHISWSKKTSNGPYLNALNRKKNFQFGPYL